MAKSFHTPMCSSANRCHKVETHTHTKLYGVELYAAAWTISFHLNQEDQTCPSMKNYGRVLWSVLQTAQQADTCIYVGVSYEAVYL